MNNILIGIGSKWRGGFLACARNDMASLLSKGKAEAIRSANRLCFPLWHIKYCHSER
jgi:hypothetical protein